MPKKNNTQLKKILSYGAVVTVSFWLAILSFFFLGYDNFLGITVLLYLAFCLTISFVIFMRLYRRYDNETKNNNVHVRLIAIVGAVSICSMAFIMAYPLKYILP